MRVNEWIAEIRNLGLDHKGEILLALKTLETWEAFAREYADMGIFQIKRLIEENIEDLKEEKLNEAWSNYSDIME